MVYLLFHNFVEKYDKVLKSLGTVMAVIFLIFMLYVTMASIISSILEIPNVNYTVLLSSLMLTFVIIYWYVKVTKTFK
jgi:hypothetical protein